MTFRDRQKLGDELGQTPRSMDKRHRDDRPRPRHNDDWSSTCVIYVSLSDDSLGNFTLTDVMSGLRGYTDQRLGRK